MHLNARLPAGIVGAAVLTLATFGFAGAGNAAPVGPGAAGALVGGAPIETVAQGCGPGFRRGAYGRCRPAYGPGRYGQRRCFFVRTAYGPRRVCRR